jgi:hypothetical protein
MTTVEYLPAGLIYTRFTIILSVLVYSEDSLIVKTKVITGQRHALPHLGIFK